MTTRLIGSVVAVCGVIMMSMTTPIMVSNFHSLYINSVVGEPSSIKKIRRESGPSPESSVSAGSTSFSAAQSYIAPWKRQSFRISSADIEGNCSAQQVEPQKARVCRVPACCRLPGKRRLACVHPKKNSTSVSKDSLTREFRAKTTTTEHISPTVVSNFLSSFPHPPSLSLARSLSCASAEAKKEKGRISFVCFVL